MHLRVMVALHRLTHMLLHHVPCVPAPSSAIDFMLVQHCNLLSVSRILSYLVPKTVQSKMNGYHYTHFIDEETKAQRDYMIQIPVFGVQI